VAYRVDDDARRQFLSGGNAFGPSNVLFLRALTYRPVYGRSNELALALDRLPLQARGSLDDVAYAWKGKVERQHERLFIPRLGKEPPPRSRDLFRRPVDHRMPRRLGDMEGVEGRVSDAEQVFPVGGDPQPHVTRRVPRRRDGDDPGEDLDLPVNQLQPATKRRQLGLGDFPEGLPSRLLPRPRRQIGGPERPLASPHDVAGGGERQPALAIHRPPNVVWMSAGATPMACRFASSRPVCGPRRPAPVSTNTVCSPVSMSRQMYGLIHAVHGGGWRPWALSACVSGSGGALANSRVGGGGKRGGV
jgi:hypothetical protein